MTHTKTFASLENCTGQHLIRNIIPCCDTDCGRTLDKLRACVATSDVPLQNYMEAKTCQSTRCHRGVEENAFTFWSSFLFLAKVFIRFPNASRNMAIRQKDL